MSVARERTRTVAWEDPMVSAKAAMSMNGLEFLRAMQKGEVPVPPICELVDFEPVEVEEGRVLYRVSEAAAEGEPGATSGRN